MKTETGIELITKERQRQINIKGWTAEHDDSHYSGELYLAAKSYYHADKKTSKVAPSYWPWIRKWWKPSNEQRNLERAGALALAEKDRLDRFIDKIATEIDRLQRIK